MLRGTSPPLSGRATGSLRIAGKHCRHFHCHMHNHACQRARGRIATMTCAHRLMAGRSSPHRKTGVHHLVASVIDTVVNLAKRRGLVYPVGRDLRRHQIGMGLRAAGGGTQGEHQTAVVARGRHRPRRRRRPGLLDHPAARGVGCLRARRGVQRPAGGMPDLPQAAPRKTTCRRPTQPRRGSPIPIRCR